MRRAFKSGDRQFITEDRRNGEVYVGVCQLHEKEWRQRVREWWGDPLVGVLLLLTVFVIGIMIGICLKVS